MKNSGVNALKAFLILMLLLFGACSDDTNTNVMPDNDSDGIYDMADNCPSNANLD